MSYLPLDDRQKSLRDLAREVATREIASRAASTIPSTSAAWPK